VFRQKVAALPASQVFIVTPVHGPNFLTILQQKKKKKKKKKKEKRKNK